MPDLVGFLTAALVVAAGMVRRRQIRPVVLTHAQRHMFISLVAAAAALVLLTPSVQTASQSLVGLPYLARLAADGATLLSVFSAIVMVASVTAGPDRAAVLRRKRRLAAALLVTFALVTLGFASSEISLGSASEADIQYVVAQLVYWGFLGACVLRFILLLSRYLTHQDVSSRMRWAMCFRVVSAAVCMMWVVFNICGVMISYLTQRQPDTFATDFNGLAAISAILTAIAMMVPVLPVSCRNFVRRYRTNALLRALTPLWRELTATVPTVLLRQAALDENPSVLLYRRVIEIRDAELVLMTYAPAAIYELVALDCPRQQVDYVAVRVEAVALSVAIDRYRAKAQPFGDSVTVNDASVNAMDLLQEACWLARVHRAIRSDKVVARLRREAAALSARSEP